MAWLGTLLIGGVLIAGGFGAGVLLGVVTEEPAVLAGYWTGLSERVDLAVANPAELPPKQPAGALEAGGAAAAQNQPLAASASTLPAVGAPLSGFAVQVGAFSSSEAARSMRARLEGGGYESFVAAAAASRDRRWRVRVGPFTTRDEAHRTASRLERREGLSTWVVSLGHGS